VKTRTGWKTRNRPLTDRVAFSYLEGTGYPVAVLGRWYPEYCVLDIDEKPLDLVVKIREQLGLDETNSMLFETSKDSYHLIIKPLYKDRPPTLKMLNDSLYSLASLYDIEIYPQANKTIRLPFAPDQKPLDPEFSSLGDWKSFLYWFQKLNDFELTSVRHCQFNLDFAENQQRERLPLMPDVEQLLREGLQAPGTRHESQFKILYFFWRNNFCKESAIELCWQWIQKKHNGLSKDFNRHPAQVKKEIERQANKIWADYDRAKIYPDSVHNLHYGFISKPDLKDILVVSECSLPKARFLFHLVRYFYPRRYQTFVNIHSNRLIEWASKDSYLKHLSFFESKGILKRGDSYLTKAFSKAIKLNWDFRPISEAVFYDGRSVETLEEAIRLCFKPEEVKQIVESARPGSRWVGYDLVAKVWGSL
jgi:hypothetical protein